MMTKKTKVLFTAAMVICALCGGLFAQTTPPAGSPVTKHGTLSVKNGKIVNKDNQPVALRGMSFFWNIYPEGTPYYTAGTTNWLASDWKVDIVRVAISPSATGSLWETVVQAAIDKGIYVIIDWHSHSAENEKSAATSFFQTQAGKYKNTPNVLFEIYNEPIAQSWSTIKSYATDVVSAIRGAGADNIIIIGSRDYSKRVDEVAASPITGRENLVYSVHYYTATSGTQHTTDLRAWCTEALGKGLALFVSEFGISQSGGGRGNGEDNRTDTVEANRWFEYLDRNSIGWANWSICNKDEAASALKSGANGNGNWDAGDLSLSGTFIRQKLIDYATKTWTVNVTKSGEGTVTADPPGPNYKHGSMVTLTATASPGWTFERWSGTDGSNLGTRNPATFSSPLYSSKSVQAVFGQGSMIKNGTFTVGISEWGSSGVTLAHDDATLKVTVNGSTAFIRQTGLNMESGKKYTLSFRAKAATGSVSVTPRITNSGGTSYWEGEAVALTTAWNPVSAEFCMSSATDAAAQIRFQSNNASGSVWNIDDIMLDASGTCQGTAVLPAAVKAQRTTWSVTRVSGALQLRGPADAGARVSLYDMRGKAVRGMAAVDGLTLGAGVPAGSYLVVVRNRAGGEVLRTRVVLAR